MSTEEEVNALLAEGNAACGTQDYENAVECFGRAISTALQAWGDKSYQLVYPLMGLARAIDRGRVLENHSEIAKMLELEERALAIAEAYPTMYEQELPRMIAAVGHTLRKAGRYQEAKERFEVCIAISERVLGESWSTAHELFNLGNLLMDMKRPDEALPLLQRALEMEERVRPEKQSWVTVAHIGRCLLDLDCGEEALPHLEKALAIRTSRKGPEAQDQTADEIREWIAEANEKRSVESPV